MSGARRRKKSSSGPTRPRRPRDRRLSHTAPGAVEVLLPDRREEPSSVSEPEWERQLVAAGASGPAPGRIALPASGLADEILSRPDAAAIEVVEPAAPPSSPDAAPEQPARTHNISFFAAPQREEQTAAEATEHLATFFLANEEYGVDVRVVQEIIRVSEITHVPRAPEFMRGVINLRGRIIPVVDLRRKLGLGTVEASRQARIVVATLDDRAIGLLVDGASQVLRIPLSCVEPPPEEFGEAHASYIRGVAKLEDRLIILVDLRKALALELSESGSEAPTE